MSINKLYNIIYYHFHFNNSIQLLKNYNVIQWIYGDLSFLKNNNDESIWGKSLMSNKYNNYWTHYFGEELTKELLLINNINSYKPIMKNNLLPDIETVHNIIEVKTLMYKNKNSTINEKILGCPFKYADIPVIYNKPLIILCIGGAEETARNKYKILGDINNNISNNRKVLLESYKNLNISYSGARDMLNIINNKLS
jgi:hypothetical protein